MIDKSQYDRTEIPQELDAVVSGSIREGRSRRRKQEKVRSHLKRGGCALAALTACLVLLLNLSPTVAKAMSQIPLLGELCRVVTFREYHFTDEIKYVDVRIPQIENWGKSQLEQRVNLEIQKKIHDCIQESEAIAQDYYEAFVATGGKPEDFHPIGITVDYEVKTINQKYASFVIWKCESFVRAYEQWYYYNIDLQSGRILSLKDWFGNDYRQIVAKHVEEDLANWDEDQRWTLWADIDVEDLISENTDFYINPEGQVVVVFPRYSLACGAAGRLEFVIE